MSNTDEILDEKAKRRVRRFVASGMDPRGYYVRAERMRKLIRELKEVPEDTKKRVLAHLEQELVRGEKLVDAFKLGVALGRFWQGETRDPKGLIRIINELRDLSKLPFVSVRGKAVQ